MESVMDTLKPVSKEKGEGNGERVAIRPHPFPTNEQRAAA